MIRIRVRKPSETVWDSAFNRTGVELTVEPNVVALEAEKNGPEQFLLVNDLVRPVIASQWTAGPRLFKMVAVETRSGCNYSCSFCPVSKNVDPRSPGEMPMEILERIAQELSSLRFSNRIALFGNNEPLLDYRLPEIVRVFRTCCPKSDIRILTNGTYATISFVRSLFEAGLSTLVINNYTDGRRIIAPVRKLVEVADKFNSFDIRVNVRSRVEVLTTRAGTSPNKPVPNRPPTGFCALPFTDLHISYTGTVNLCCFDAYGTVSMGNVTDNSILDIWQSVLFNHYRQGLLDARRAGLPLCEKCDYDGFRDPLDNDVFSRTRNDFRMRAKETS